MGFDKASDSDLVVKGSRLGGGEGHGVEKVERFIGDGVVASEVRFVCLIFHFPEKMMENFANFLGKVWVLWFHLHQRYGYLEYCFHENICGLGWIFLFLLNLEFLCWYLGFGYECVYL